MNHLGSDTPSCFGKIIQEKPRKTLSNWWEMASQSKKPVIVVARKAIKMVKSSRKLRFVLFIPLPFCWCGFHEQETAPADYSQ